MDTELLVEDQIDAGRKFIQRLVRSDIDVIVACWLKTSEEGRWFLYIASGTVDEKGLAATYRDVYGVLGNLLDTSISMSEIKLIGRENSITKDLLAIQRGFAAKLPTRSWRQQIGSIAIEELYIYPLPGSDECHRVSFTITYSRQGKDDKWIASTKRGERYEGIDFKGVVSYSTASWEGESAEDQKFTIVSVLLEIDPEVDDEQLLNRPDIRRMLARQARALADERFKSRHPNARVEPEEEDD